MHPQIWAEKTFLSLWKAGLVCIQGDQVGVTGVGLQSQWTVLPCKWELENLTGARLAVSMVVLPVELTSAPQHVLTHQNSPSRETCLWYWTKKQQPCVFLRACAFAPPRIYFGAFLLASLLFHPGSESVLLMLSFLFGVLSKKNNWRALQLPSVLDDYLSLYIYHWRLELSERIWFSRIVNYHLLLARSCFFVP